jgi:hypothetical protein
VPKKASRGPAAPPGFTPPGGPKPARARGRRRSELLQPDATVSLAEERSTAGIDDVFTTLDNQLVGLVPVKKKVAEMASLLLVDRVRHKFGLSAPRLPGKRAAGARHAR